MAKLNFHQHAAVRCLGEYLIEILHHTFDLARQICVRSAFIL
jgi:hypothetical protein